MTTTSLLDRPIYSFADVDRLVGLHSGTARRWIDGYSRAGVHYPPVLRPEQTGVESVTWGEMVEARLLAEFRYKGVSLQRLRPAVERLRDEFGLYPLAQARPLLDVQGRELVQRVQDEVDLQRELHLVVVRSGQAVLNLPTQRFADSAKYDDGVVVSLRPLSRAPEVQMDPGRSFGQPAIRSVRTEILAEEYRAGATRERLAELYELSLEQVDDALRYEMTMSSQQAA